MAGGKLISTGVEFPDATTQTTSGLPLTGGTMTGTIAGFTSTGIDDNATSNAITIDASENVGIGTTLPSFPQHIKRNTTIGTALYVELDSALSGSDWEALEINSNANGVNTSFIGFEFDSIASGTGPAIGSIRTGGATANLKLYSTTADTRALAVTIDHTQDVIVEAGNLVIGTSGKGIDFSAATPDGTGTTGSEVLDDYEEGTWTPGGATGFPGGGAPQSITATYTKVGDTVSVRAVFNAYNDGTNLNISGLPFSASAESAASISIETGKSFVNERVSGSSFYCTISGTDTSLRTFYLEATYRTA